jgi:ribonuclease BN (tRNA processing enzyme)
VSGTAPGDGVRRISRRGAVATLAGSTLATLSACGAGADAQRNGDPSVSETASGDAAIDARTKVVLLGTAGGPPILSGDRYGISTAIVYDGRVYVVDLGLGSYHRLAQADLGLTDVPASQLSNLRGILFTHLHSDHVADWPSLYATIPSNITGRVDQDKITVLGPGPRDSLVRVYPESREAPELIGGEDPTPGLVSLTRQFRSAWAADLNDRTRDSNYVDPGSLFDIREIDLHGIWEIDPAGVPPRLERPIEVWTDGDVRISATLVDHHPTAPAFAYRFDTPDGSVVVSGDTTVSANLIALAQGADILVHEVIDAAWVEQIVEASPAHLRESLREHLIASHTTIEQVGRQVAAPAGVATLVLTHLAPSTHEDSAWAGAQDGFDGKVVVGHDLLVLPVPG